LCLRDGKPLGEHVRRRRPLFAGLAVLVLLGSGGFYAMKNHHTYGAVRIETDPAGASVIVGDTLRPSPAEFSKMPTGRYSAHVMLAGYEPEELAFEVKA